MKNSVVRNFSKNIGNLLPSLHSKTYPHQISPFLASSSSINYRLFSSKTSEPSEFNLGQIQNKDETFDADNMSNKELKKQIEKMYEGDENAFASVFETVLRRKLAGKTDDLDEELIKELPENPRPDDFFDDKDDGSDSD